MEPLSSPTQTAQPLSPNRPKRFWVLAVAVIVLVLVGGSVLSAPKSFPNGANIFTISEGEGLKSVTAKLASDGYIRSSFVFSGLVTLMGGDRHISPGDYHFASGENAFGIATQIALGKHDLVPIKVTVPEGTNVAEIATVLSEKIPGFDAKTFITDATLDEGYLFPETYFFYSSTTPAEVVASMRAMFDRKTAGMFTTAALGTHTETDIVTMASLVEGEASGNNNDRATIAGILWKRISLGMRLDVDAAPDTYKHGGLPASPITNPGLESLKAALNPAQTPYLYYLHDKNGTIHYAKTYAEHQANIAKYLK